MRKLLAIGAIGALLAFFSGAGTWTARLVSADPTIGATACAEDAPADDTGGDEGDGSDTDTATTSPIVDERSWWDNLVAAGVCGLVQILLSIVAVALIIDAFVNIRRDRLMPPHILGELEQLFEDEDYEEALNLCDTEDCYLTRIVGAGLAKQEDGYDMMAYAMEQQGDTEAMNLHVKISYIALIAMVEPMLGLFGTVFGMIKAFSKIAAMSGAANPSDLAESISMALVTTFLGLLIAIPVLACHVVLRNRILGLVQESGMITSELFARFRASA